MGTVLLFYGIIFGIALGVSVSLLVTVWAVKTSNDIGDSEGDFMDFGDFLDVISDEDNLTSPNGYSKRWDGLF